MALKNITARGPAINPFTPNSCTPTYTEIKATKVGRKRPRALALVEPRRLPVLSGRCPHQTGIALVPLPPSEPGVQIFRTGLPKISLSGLDCPMDHLGLG